VALNYEQQALLNQVSSMFWQSSDVSSCCHGDDCKPCYGPGGRC